MKAIIIGLIIATLWSIPWSYDAAFHLSKGESMPSFGYAIVGAIGAFGIMVFASKYGTWYTLADSKAKEARA